MQECPRCGTLYCDDHGDALCERCADPVLAVPSYRVFRGSLLALLVGSVVAVWLLVLPPGGTDQDGPPSSLQGVLQTATPRASASASAPASATPTASPSPSQTPSATPAPTATATPAPTPAPTAAPAPTPTTYTVQPGDNLIGIAQRFGVTPDALQRANSISNPSNIQPGQVLTIPR